MMRRNDAGVCACALASVLAWGLTRAGAVSAQLTPVSGATPVRATDSQGAGSSGGGLTPASLRASPVPERPDAGRVDQTRGDVGPVAASLARTDASVDLRTPTGFESVYRLRGFGGIGGSDAYARRSGALTAVFARSQYSRGEQGALRADVPAGTLFYIGRLPDAPAAPAPGRRIGQAETQVFSRVAGRVDGAASSSAEEAAPVRVFERGPESRAPAPPRPAIVTTEESYRVQRTAELLRAAVSAGDKSR